MIDEKAAIGADNVFVVVEYVRSELAPKSFFLLNWICPFDPEGNDAEVIAPHPGTARINPINRDLSSLKVVTSVPLAVYVQVEPDTASRRRNNNGSDKPIVVGSKVG